MDCIAEGKRDGDVYGSYTLVVEGIDAQGNIVSTNTSDSKTFENNWESAAMRFRPHEDATSFRIQVPLRLSPHRPVVRCTLTVTSSCDSTSHVLGQWFDCRNSRINWWTIVHIGYNVRTIACR